MHDSRTARAFASLLKAAGCILILASILTGLALPVAWIITGYDIDFWLPIGVVVFLPIIFFLYPLLALSQLIWSPTLIVYGGLIGGMFLLRLSNILTADNALEEEKDSSRL